jgi:hypothetical protein
MSLNNFGLPSCGQRPAVTWSEWTINDVKTAVYVQQLQTVGKSDSEQRTNKNAQGKVTPC